MDFSYATTTSTADWQEWIGQNIAVHNGGLELATTTAIEQSLSGSAVVDVAIGPDDNLYTLRSSGELYRHDQTADLTQRLWTRSDGNSADPNALCVADRQAFIVDGSDGTITVVSTRLQRSIGTLETDVTDPVRVAHADGVLFLLDSIGQIQTIDRITGTESISDSSLVDPVDLAVSDEGHGYVLDRNDGNPVIRSVGSELTHVADRFPITNDAFSVATGAFVPTALAVADGTLFLAGRLENGSHVLFERDAESGSFHQRHQFTHSCETLVARSVASDCRRNVFAVLGPDGHSHHLYERHQHARHPRRERHVGNAFYRYDSGADETEWHRLTLSLSQLTASTQVRVRYAATNRPALCDSGLDDLETVPSDAIDSLCGLGVTSVWDLASSDTDRLTSGLPDATQADVQTWRTAALEALAAHATADWTSVDSLNPDDVLLRDAIGRYLFVSLELDGSPLSSPRVDSITAFCPRQSYLRYLPELYQEDTASATFLAQYLSVFESVFADLELEIEQISRYFDPEAVPSDALSWLEQWLALEPDGEWSESARRELLSLAPDLYKRRGTKAGLRSMLELSLWHMPSKSATSPTRSMSNNVDNVVSTRVAAQMRATASDTTQTIGDTPSGHRLFFLDDGDLECLDRESARSQYPLSVSGPQTVAVFCGPFETDDQLATIETIVASETPAHVDATVVELDDELTLDGDTFLGINSRLTDRQFSLGRTTLGENTVLVDRSESK